MKLYNSLTRKKEDFKTNEPGKVAMYTCGPTVYHFAHIGNLRSYIMEDVLEKHLGYIGYQVKRVMNITDVGHLASDADTGEDKMLSGARRERKTVMEIAKFYTDAFFEDCKKLNIKIPEIVVPATSCIPEFIAMIEQLIADEYAYLAGGNIYFDTSKLPEYYVFNKHDSENLESAVRDGVEIDQNKRNKTDFVMWFTKSKFDDQELKWDSPWGIGYPGWHIECSAIAKKYLGEYLDIHCGGIDNAFPHHTNEIAQSEAYFGHKWCNFWFHVMHLNINSGKMSKSSGEFLTVDVITKKGYHPMVYRFFCLGSHYRKPLAFTYEGMDGAKTAFDKLVSRISALKKGDFTPSEQGEQLRQAFTQALNNDLNTSLAITALYDVLKADIADGEKIGLLSEFDSVLSLDLMDIVEQRQNQPESTGDDDAQRIEQLLAQRAQAKADRDFKTADEIRDQLKAEGIVITDTPQGATWKREQ